MPKYKTPHNKGKLVIDACVMPEIEKATRELCGFETIRIKKSDSNLSDREIGKKYSKATYPILTADTTAYKNTEDVVGGYVVHDSTMTPDELPDYIEKYVSVMGEKRMKDLKGKITRIPKGKKDVVVTKLKTK